MRVRGNNSRKVKVPLSNFEIESCLVGVSIMYKFHNIKLRQSIVRERETKHKYKHFYVNTFLLNAFYKSHVFNKRIVLLHACCLYIGFSTPPVFPDST